MFFHVPASELPDFCVARPAPYRIAWRRLGTLQLASQQSSFSMPRFVLLRHETPAGSERPTHFDLMLEHNGVLRTWALSGLPAAGEPLLAEQLPDHRLAYLDYEGE